MDPEIYLAPMSGITDLPFRLISRELGARFCFFEMVDSHAMAYEHASTLRILKTVKKDRPIAAQLLGDDPDMMLDAALKLLKLVEISFLDINSACPVKKVVKKGDGAALLKNRARLGRIIKKLAGKLPVPVTVKLRTGFDKRDVGECVKTAEVCQSSGASRIFIHGRTAAQGYSGDIDYESIRAVKEALEIPVYGSGNILTPAMAKKMLDETGCDGILVARGAQGNPWIFKDIERYLKDGIAAMGQGLSLKKKILKKHLAYVDKYKDMSHAGKIGFMGKITTWYLKGFPRAAKIRAEVYKAGSYQRLIELIEGVK